MKKILPMLVLFLVTLACATPGAVPTLVPTPIPLPTEAPAATNTPPPAETTNESVATDAPYTGPICVERGIPQGLGSGNYAEIADRILTDLNRGVTGDDLYLGLDALRIGNQPAPVAVADFTGDGFFDYAVSVYDRVSNTNPKQGRLLIYICDGAEQFEQVADIDSGETSGGPKLWFWEDLNADGTAEILYSTVQCGAHTCTEQIFVLTWRGDEFVSILQGSSDDLPNPQIQLIDYDGDGIMGIEVSGTGAGSVGAGPPRGVSRVWEYGRGSRTWSVANEIVLPSNFRIHAIHDADDTAFRGDLEIALLLYRQSIANPEMIDWIYPSIEQLNLGAYARYKMAIIHTIRGDEAAASDVLNDMSFLINSRSDQWVFVEMANGFRNAYFSGSVEAGCDFVIKYATDHAELVLDPLGSVAFGYNNRDYTPQDMCPVALGE